jgi:cytochrome c biogenesis protein CcdA
MPEMKTYELYLSLFFKIFVFGIFGLLIIVGIVIIVTGIFFFTENNVSLLIMGIFMTIIAGGNFLWIFSFPHRIAVSDTGEITFISLLRRRQTNIAEIESIKPDPSQFFGFLVIRTQNKKIKILNQFDGFHDFILNLKSKKPSIELRGC